MRYMILFDYKEMIEKIINFRMLLDWIYQAISEIGDIKDNETYIIVSEVRSHKITFKITKNDWWIVIEQYKIIPPSLMLGIEIYNRDKFLKYFDSDILTFTILSLVVKKETEIIWNDDVKYIIWNNDWTLIIKEIEIQNWDKNKVNDEIEVFNLFKK